MFFATVWTFFWMVVAQCTAEHKSALIEDVFSEYDKTEGPKQNKVGLEQQVGVSIEVFIVSIYSISEINMDYSMSLFLRERWIDERLSYNNTMNITRLELDHSRFGDVWIPDTFIVNEKESSGHDITVPNKLLHIYQDGTVQFSMRITGSFSCLMYLEKYPFDTQECKFEVESYGHSTEKLSFKWGDKPLTFAKNLKVPDFQLTSSEAYQCDKNYYGITFPCVGIKLTLERNYNYHIVQIYIPTTLIVVLSWINFWLDHASVPARITLALLTVLTLTTQIEGYMMNMPRVSYVKAIDVWMAICLTFVFLALIEFAFVNVQNRKSVKRRNDSICTETVNGISQLEMALDSKKTSCNIPCFRQSDVDSNVRQIDKVSRVAFPASFVIFNIFYWTYYFSILSNRKHPI